MRGMIFFAAGLAIAASFAAAPDAAAQRRGQSPGVVVLDYNRVLAESTLGRDMATRLQAVRTELATEAQGMQGEAQSIDAESQRLQQAHRNQTAEQLQNNPQVRALAERLEQFQQRRAALEGSMQCTEAIALRDLNAQITPVVRSVMESRGALVVVGRESVRLALPEADITSTVIEQLNQGQATRTATVARRQVTDCQAQQTAQAPAAPR